MTTEGSALARYLRAVTELQSQVIESQHTLLLDIAKRMAEAIQRDQRIFIFGTGHSHLLAEEAFYRAGGLANVVPILSEHFMLHNLPALGSRIERTPDLANMILDRYAPEAGEILFVVSNSGVNHLPVEMALQARKREMFVVGISSFAYACEAPLSDLGLRLDQAVDFALDNGGFPGDALLEMDELNWRVAPSSTIVNSLIWNGLVAETAHKLQEQGITPPVYISLNVDGAAEHNQALLEKWRPRNIHL
ncbi:MAG: SIS domain-containing protein [Chloroflexi bacterium]|nr:SIS domain-containing protein [Chloroflexota bacterium]